jgi:hypothetical protein
MHGTAKGDGVSEISDFEFRILELRNLGIAKLEFGVQIFGEIFGTGRLARWCQE